MVRGLDLFAAYFREYIDQYVLIGGSACFVLFQDAGQDFRPTVDLDIVLCLESLTAEFTQGFAGFISSGSYEVKEKIFGDRILYRFSEPGDQAYPRQIELFSAKPLDMDLSEGSTITPIKIDDEYVSLSAILLSEAYYGLIHEGKTVVDGMSVLKPEYMMLLKVKAWLDLSDRKKAGQKVDSSDIKKHLEDVFRLLTLLTPDTRMEPVNSIKADLQEFVSRCAETEVHDFARFKLDMSRAEALEMLETIYRL